MARFGNSVYGFEMKVRFHLREKYGMDPEQFLQGLRRWGFDHFIVLQRRNQLRRTVSNRVALKTSQWEVRESGDHPGLVQIEIKDLNQLVERIRDLEEQDRVMLPLLKDDQCLVLTYEEDIAEDPSVAYEKICSFVGLDAVPVDVNLRRVNPYPLTEIVTNFSEVRRALKGHSFEWMAYE
jgi:LPS sulfotransferase NodH